MSCRDSVQAGLTLVLLAAGIAWLVGEGERFDKRLSAASHVQERVEFSPVNLPVVFYPRDAERAVTDLSADLARILSTILGVNVASLPEPLFTGQPGIYLGETVFARRIGFSWGDPNPPAWQPQSAWMQSFGKSLLFVGRNDRALAAGVYRWLQEDAGARWFTALPSGEDLPRRARIVVEPTRRRVFAGSFLGAMLGGNRGEGRALWSLRHGLHQRYSFNHNLDRLIQPQDFEENPDIFPLRDGRPYRPDRRGQYSWQPNLARPETARWVADAAIDHFSTHPDSESFSVATNDNADFGEYPPIFKRGYFRGYPDLSHLVFSFTNRVARLVGEVFPDRLIGQLAYYAAENPPDYKLLPNVLPAYTADRSQWYDPAFKEEDKQTILRWAQSGARVVGTWDYSFGYPYLTPRIYNKEKLESIQFLHQAGFQSYYTQTSEIWGFDAPKLWPAAQLLWDVSQDPETLQNEFYQRYFGPAASTMRAFFSEAELLWMTQPGQALWIKYYLDLRHALLFPPDAVRRMRELLNSAQNEALAEPFRSRVALTADAFRLTEAISDLAHAADQLENLQNIPHNWLQVLQDYYAKRAAADNLVQIFLQPANPNHLHGDPRTYLFRSDSAGRLLWNLAQHKGLPVLADRLVSRGEDLPMEQLFNACDLTEARFPDLLENGGFENQLEGWRTYTRDTDNLIFQLSTAAARSGQQGLEVINADFNRIWHLAEVQEGQNYTAEAYLRGQLAQASRVELRLSFYDQNNQQIGPFYRDRLPHGQLTQWHQLAVPATAPQGATRALLLLHIRHMEPQDFLHADDLSLKQWLQPQDRL